MKEVAYQSRQDIMIRDEYETTEPSLKLQISQVIERPPSVEQCGLESSVDKIELKQALEILIENQDNRRDLSADANNENRSNNHDHYFTVRDEDNEEFQIHETTIGATHD